MWIGNEAFYLCQGLTSITLGNSVIGIGDWAFSGCKILTSVTIPNSVTWMGEGAFRGCVSLTSITISENVTSISDDAFVGCKKLSSVVIPKNVMSIGEHAFWGCIGLTSVTIPNNVTYIGESAFKDCTGLTSLSVLAVVPPTIETSTFSNVSTTISVYVPCSTRETYQEDSKWNGFTNYIENIAYTVSATSQNEAMGFVQTIKEATCTDNECTIKAVANNGYTFTQWSDGNTNNPRTIIVDKDMTLEAEFIPATAIDNISAANDNQPQKVLYQGQLLILSEGGVYTPTGVKVNLAPQDILSLIDKP